MSKAKLTPEQQKAAALKKALPFSDVATTLSERFFPDGVLGRVDETRSGEMQNILNQYQAMQRQAFDNPRSADVTDLLSRYKSSLAGYSAPELQAQRESAARGIDTSYKTGLRQLALSQARSGVRGAAATAQANNLNRERMGQQQQLEQDLFVKNADEMQKRLGQYGDVLRSTEGDEFNRRQSTLGQYTTALTGARNDELGRRQFNLSQIAKENAGKAGLFFGANQLGLANKAQEENTQLNKLAIGKIGRGTSSGGGGGGFDMAGYINAITSALGVNQQQGS